MNIHSDARAMQFESTVGKGNDAFQWVHMLSDDENSLNLMKKLQVPEVAIEGLVAEETRPKAITMDNGVLVYLRAINLNHQANPDDMVSLRLWLSDGLVISTTKHQRSLRSVNELKEMVDKPLKVKNIGDFLCALFEKITDKICDEVENYESQLELLEEQLANVPDQIERLQLIDIRRQSAHIKRFIMPQKEAFEATIYCVDNLTKIQNFRVKEQSDRVSRYLDNIDVVRERSVLIQEELRILTAEKQSERMYVLSLVTAIFLPLSFLTGVFGMNVAGLPGVETTYAFNLLISVMTFLAISILVIMKWRKWF